MNRFKLRMESLCLGYHHLGNIELRLGRYYEAIAHLDSAKALSQKYVKDAKLRKIIENDADNAKKTPNRVRYPSRSKPVRSATKRREVSSRSIRRNFELSSTWTSSFKVPSTQDLIKELLNDTGGTNKRSKSRTRCSSAKRTDTFNSTEMLSGFSTGANFHRFRSSSNFRFNDTGMLSETGIDDRDLGDISSFQIITQDLARNNKEVQVYPTFRAEVFEIEAEEDVKVSDLEVSERKEIDKIATEPVKGKEIPLIDEISRFKILESAAIKIQRLYKLHLLNKRSSNLQSSKQPNIEITPEISSIADKQSSIDDFSLSLDSESKLDSSISSHDRIKSESSEKHCIIRRADASDYLTLLTPEITAIKRLGSDLYTWTLKIADLLVIGDLLKMNVILIGHGYSMADNLYISIPLKFQPDKCSDFRISFPFSFETIWPIVEYCCQKAAYDTELKSEFTQLWPSISSDLNTSTRRDIDELAIQKARDFLCSIINSLSLESHILGKKLTSSPSSSYTPSTITYDPSEELYLQYKDGVIKNISILKEHRVFSDLITDNIDSNFTNPIVLNRSVIQLGGMHLFLVLKIEHKHLMIKSKYNSCLVCNLHSLKNTWKDEFEISWESFEQFMHIAGYKLNILDVIMTKTLPLEAKEIYDKYFHTCIRILDTRARFQLSDFELDLPSEAYKIRLEVHNTSPDSIFFNLTPKCNSIVYKDFLADHTFPHMKVQFKSTESQIDLSPYITSADEPIIRIPFCSISGENEPLLMKLYINSCTSAILAGKSSFTGRYYTLDISKPNRIQRLALLSDQEIELTKTALEKKVIIESSMTGKVMRFSNKLERKVILYRGTVEILEEVYMMTLYTKEGRVYITLYNISNSYQFTLKLLPEDLTTCFGFKSISHLSNLASKPLRLFKLVNSLEIFRNTLGKQIAIKSSSSSLPIPSSNLGKFYNYPIISSTNSYYITKHTIEAYSSPHSDLMYIHSKPILILQRSKFIFSYYAILTILRHSEFDEWRIQLHFLHNSRSFSCRLYESDLHNLPEEALDKQYSDSNHIFNTARPEIQVWELIAEEMRFEKQTHHELVMRFDEICIPMKEMVYSNYLRRGDLVYYIEVYFKSTVGLKERFPVISNMKEAMKVVLSFRSYDFIQHMWMKANYRLDECILACINKNAMREDVLFHSSFRYSDIKRYAPLFIQHIQLPTISRHIKQKLLPELHLDSSHPPPISSLEIFEPEIHNSKRSLSSIIEHDEILYTSLYSLLPAIIISVCYNTLLDSFIIKLYKPSTGSEYRQTIEKSDLIQEIEFLDIMHKGGMYKSLCMRILDKYLDFILSKII